MLYFPNQILYLISDLNVNACSWGKRTSTIYEYSWHTKTTTDIAILLPVYPHALQRKGNPDPPLV